jgi:TetR/AcrR family transcriptional regulator
MTGKVSRVPNEERVLDVSVRLFAEHGFQGVTIRQIARAAGVTLPTIYHFYENKEALYRAVEGKLFSAHRSSLLTALRAGGSPEERLREFVRGVMTVLMDNPDYHRILTRSLVENDPGNHAYLVETSLQPVMDELRGLLSACRPGPGQGFSSVFIFGCILGMVTLRPVIALVGGNDFVSLPSERQIDEVVAAVLRAILG